MKLLDIAPRRPKRRQLALRFAKDGHEVVAVPGRHDALRMLRRGGFDLVILDADSELYDTPEIVRELRQGGCDDVMIALLVEPRSRPPSRRLTGRAANVVLLQNGSVEHMVRMVHLALSVRAEAGAVD